MGSSRFAVLIFFEPPALVGELGMVRMVDMVPDVVGIMGALSALDFLALKRGIMGLSAAG